MAQNLSLWELDKTSSEKYNQLLQRAEADLSEYLEKAKVIVDAVRERGDAAVCEFTSRFDGAPVTPGSIRVTDAEFEKADKEISAEVRAALLFAADNIRRYHQTQMPKPIAMSEVGPGVLAGERWGPIPSVACYVPRGKGSFPSVALMTAIPAVVAGVPRVVMLTPPGPDGSVDAATLFGARLAGVTEVYKCGGAQGVAAVAYGTESVGKCDKIVGPGSSWVVAAKQLLARHIDPGPPAGPSESIVIADSTANPWKAALDLVNESEHGPDSSAFLVTDDRKIAEEIDRLVPKIWVRLSEKRRGFSQTVLAGERGGIVLCKDRAQVVQFTNDYAAEHLQVHSQEAFAYLDKLVHAGEILLGEHAAISLGNFVLGPNAVLPTARAARTSSPLSVYDYLKRTSVAYVTAEGYARLAPSARILAEYEGFEAHALAVSPLRDQKEG
jgi:histidinol dehydrogenase